MFLDHSGYYGNHYYVSLIDFEFAVGVGKLLPWYKKLSLIFWAGMFYGFGKFIFEHKNSIYFYGFGMFISECKYLTISTGSGSSSSNIKI